MNYENVPIVYLFLRQWLIVINNFRTKTKKRKNRRWKNNFPIVLLTIKLYFSIHSWKGWNWIFFNLKYDREKRHGTIRNKTIVLFNCPTVENLGNKFPLKYDRLPRNSTKRTVWCQWYPARILYSDYSSPVFSLGYDCRNRPVLSFYRFYG